MRDATKILTRHPQNPLLHIKDYPGIAQIYNPSPVQYKDETILLVSVVDYKTERLGRDVGQTRLARSKDGINFELSSENFIKVPEDQEPYDKVKHFIDNRVTKIDDSYYIVTPVMWDEGYDAPTGMLGVTKDFETYKHIDIITQPKNRGASLFPEKINGKYWKLDRPGGGDGGDGDIWISSSPDLIHWGSFRPLLKAGYRFWNVQKTGPTPPIKTDKGWLDIVHGVFSPAGGTYYYIGAILLDLEDPTKVIGKTSSPLLGPEMPYECNGNCDNVVFPCGAIPDYDKDQLRLYYGATDSSICLATGSLSEIVQACIDEI
jgi:beta-1,4-mannooligosaccharide/beta-1,4-mannosyl-N-acetylglucosamine phosphorylase